LRSTFDNSRLVRLLAGWQPVETESSGMDFAERMSLWFNAFDAIRLSAVHQSWRSGGAAAAQPEPATRQALRVRTLADDVRQVRATLAKLIAQEVAVDRIEPSHVSYQRRHAELQRRMDLMLSPLRDRLRQALAGASAPLRQLAELDAVLEQVVAPREQALLPTVAAFLERRFKQLRQAHQPVAGEDEVASWLPLFEKDWRDALLAELDLRLQPLTGLLEALTNPPNTEH
jgi:hypothetical protein